jgi:DNA-binding response OmpR family regulator
MYRLRRRAARILAISDEAPLLTLVQRTLRHDGLEVLAAPATTRRSAADAAPDAVIIDMAAYSLQTLLDLRQAFPQAALLVLHVGLHPLEVANLIDFGAEVLARPFRETDLRLRLSAARRRAVAQAGDAGRIRLGALSLDSLRETVFLGGRALGLAPAENAVLVQLLRSAGSVDFSTLLTTLHHPDTPVDRQYMRSLVSLLRRRLRRVGFEIVNDRRFGYRLTEAEAGAQPREREGELQ